MNQWPVGLIMDMELLYPKETWHVRQPEVGTGLEVLVYWTGLPISDATWEWFENIEAHFSDFHMAEKVNLKEKVLICSRSLNN